jgi:flagellar basal body P-ring formation protein FlgA
MKLHSSLLIFIMFFSSSISIAKVGEPQFEDHNLLREEIESFALSAFELEKDPSETLKVQVGSIDPRSKLRSCPVLVHFEFLHELSRASNTIQATCPQADNWSIYIPVRVNRFKEVVVASQPIYRGQRLSSHMIVKKLVDVSQIRGQTFESIQAILGATAKRTIAAGQTIAESSFCIVCQGDQVNIIAGSGNFSVEMTGEAINDGQFGDRIKVRNISSNKIVEGRIEQAGVIRIR